MNFYYYVQMTFKMPANFSVLAVFCLFNPILLTFAGPCSLYIKNNGEEHNMILSSVSTSRNLSPTVTKLEADQIRTCETEAECKEKCDVRDDVSSNT